MGLTTWPRRSTKQRTYCWEINLTDVDTIKSYHAHIYYRDLRERKKAALLRKFLETNREIRLGRWRDDPVGPHPCSMYQVAFPTALFSTVVPWLMLNRDDLSILVHPETGDDLVDHINNALWLGEKLNLRLVFFKTEDMRR